MFRYLAFVWNDTDLSHCAMVSALVRNLHRGSREWTEVLNLPRMAVYCSGAQWGSSQTYVLENRRGLILGRLFERAVREDVIARPVGLDARASDRIHSTGGRCLIDEYWGHYVAFLDDGAAHAIRVLRDPTGGLRCFVTSFRGVRIFFSHAEDCVQLGLSFSINLHYVAAYLAERGMPESVETGLRDVSTVLAGECVLIERDRTIKSFVWNPFQIAATDRIDDATVAIAELRGAVRTCVQAWASCYGNILHKLSGGLDSAIVLSCLRDTPSATRVMCLNHYAAGADRDERPYARLAAHRAGCGLIEMHASSTTSLEPLLQMPKSVCPSPNGRLHLLLIGREVDAVARAHGAQAIFSGEYGDMIFYRQPALPAAIDYVWLHGLRLPLFKVALDVSRLAGVSIWHVLHRAIRDGLLTRARAGVDAGVPEEAHSRIAELLGPRWRSPRAGHCSHRWFESAGTVPIGKRGHVSRAAFNTFLPDDSLAAEDHLDQVMPLYSQPIVEVSLRIALPLLVKGAWDRSIARRAFASDLPREIVTRRTKGGTEQFVRDILFRNIEFVREALLGGVLAREHMLDRDQVESALAGRPSAARTTTSDLYWMLGTEAWLRSWETVPETALQRSCAVSA